MRSNNQRGALPPCSGSVALPDRRGMLQYGKHANPPHGSRSALSSVSSALSWPPAGPRLTKRCSRRESTGSMKTALAVIAVLAVQISRPPSVLSQTTVAAQAHRGFVEIGAGTLSPTNPAIITLSLRATAGWILGGQNAISAEYTRQSANRSEGNDLGKFSRHFVGIAWQHAFHDVFSDQEPMAQQYLLRVSGGAIFRGTFPQAV